MLQILQRVLYVALCEFIELAIVYHHTRQLEETVDNLEGRLRRVDEHRWN